MPLHCGCSVFARGSPPALRRLPTLWSADGSAVDHHMRGAVEDPAEAKRIYEGVLKDVPDPDPNDLEAEAHRDAIPKHAYGEKTGITDMPLVSLGGFVALPMHLFFDRKMRCLTGCRCKAKTWLMFNALLVPIVAVVLLIVFTPEENFLPKVCLWVNGTADGDDSADGECPRWVAVTGLAIVGIALYELLAMAVLSCCEHPYHNDRNLDYSHAIGVNHVETARHYMESEAQLKPLLKAQAKKGKKWIVQTKIRCYAVEDDEDHKKNKGALYKTALESLKTIGRDKVPVSAP